MKFNINTNFLVRQETELEINPEHFLYCATIEELRDELDSYIHDHISHPTCEGVWSSELLGVEYNHLWWVNDEEESFFVKWQKLKGLPKEL